MRRNLSAPVEEAKKEKADRLMEEHERLFHEAQESSEKAGKENEERLMKKQARLFQQAQEKIEKAKVNDGPDSTEVKPTGQTKRKAGDSDPETPTYYTRSVRQKVNSSQVKYRTLQDEMRSIAYQADYKLPTTQTIKARKTPPPRTPARRPRSPLIKLRTTRYGSKFEPWNPKIEDPTIIAMKERAWSEDGLDEDDEAAPLLMKHDDEDGELEEEMREHERKKRESPKKKLPKGWVWEGEEDRGKLYEKDGEMVCDEDAEGEPDDMLP